MSGPVVFAFADPGRRTWLALSKDGSYFHVVTPTPDDAQLIVDGLRRIGQLSCSCAGGRYRGSCYVTVAAEAIEAAALSSGEAEPTWFDAPAPAGAGEEVEAFRG